MSLSYLENAALHYLERFASSSENLRRVLVRRVRRRLGPDAEEARAAAEAMIEDLVARYRRTGILDDVAYAEATAAGLHRRGRPLRAIRATLTAKGVDEATAAAAVDRLRENTADADLAAAVHLARRRRLGPFRTAERREENRRRDLAALARAGFAYDVTRRIIDAPDVEELFDDEAGYREPGSAPPRDE